MLVDDDQYNLELIKAYMADYGFRVITASDGEECLVALREERPDLILMDVRMPRMDGITACASIKADSRVRDIPVVFLSGDQDAASKVSGFKAGGVDYITKPVEEAELLARVTTHLKQTRIYSNLLKRVRAYEERFGPLDPDSNGDKEAAAALPGRHVQRVYRACEILLEDLRSPPSLRDLAVRVGTNAKKLSKDFQILYSMTAFEWLREQRIQKAAKLLRDSDLSLETVAQSVGYSSSANFCTAFKRRMNVSPIRYRGGRSD